MKFLTALMICFLFGCVKPDFADITPATQLITGTFAPIGQTTTVNVFSNWNTNYNYQIAMSRGTTPGFILGGLQIPLNLDDLMFTSLALTNTPIFMNFAGNLFPNGGAVAFFNPPDEPSLIGLQYYTAVLIRLGNNVVDVSNAPMTTIVR